ncbi:MAG: hypothetical protein EB127_18770 [Alphaproteobacteria bacterium]|nr:hypothetical protein [Alphaproteobacteria bacterium]
MNGVKWKIFDIEYEDSSTGAPSEIIVSNLDKYCTDVDVGLGNLNTRVYRTIKAITGFEAKTCKVNMLIY